MENISQHSERPDSLQLDCLPLGEEAIDQPSSKDFQWLLSEYATPRVYRIVTSWEDTAGQIDAHSMGCETKHIGAVPLLERPNGQEFALSYDIVKQQQGTLYDTLQMLTAVVTMHPTVETFALLKSYGSGLNFCPDDDPIKQWLTDHEDEIATVIAGPFYDVALRHIIERNPSAVLRGDRKIMEASMRGILPGGTAFMSSDTEHKIIQDRVIKFISDDELLNLCREASLENIKNRVVSIISNPLLGSSVDYDFVLRDCKDDQLLVERYMRGSKYEDILPEVIKLLESAKAFVGRLEQLSDSYDPGDLEYCFPLKAKDMSKGDPLRCSAEAYERRGVSTCDSLADALRTIRKELPEEHQSYVMDRLAQTLRAAQQPGMIFHALSVSDVWALREYATNPVGMLLTAEAEDLEAVGLVNEATQLQAAADRARQNIGDEAYNELSSNERLVYILAELLGDDKDAAMASLAARRYFKSDRTAPDVAIMNVALQCTSGIHVPPGILRRDPTM